MRLKIASRKSRLSIRQVELVIDEIRRVYPDVMTEIKFYRTKGDIYRDLPPTKIGSKGIFEKEVNKAVLRGEADIAVHSLKDIPVETYEELDLVAVIPRETPLESLITKDGLGFNELRPGSVIGTSSIRRKAALLNMRRDIKVRDLRGNVDTRLRKLWRGEYDAIIVAEAAIRRLGYSSNIKRYIFTPYEVTPAPCQGIIGIYARRDDKEIIDLLKKINDEDTYFEAYIEREIMRRIGGGCNVPLGIYAEKSSRRIHVITSLYKPDGSDKIIAESEGRIEDYMDLVEDIVVKVLKGGGDILNYIRGSK